jgi:3-methyladenine DNA glycosylase AlkD
MASAEEVLEHLQVLGRPDQLEGMARYGMNTEARLGVSMPDMRKLAKELGKDHELALDLWQTGIAEARIVAALVDRPELVTETQMEDWVLNLFEKSPLARKKINDWSEREEEFVKRTAFSLIACLAWHDKGADDARFIEFFPAIKHGASDERNYVKKAVNWALRNIGKRNLRLNSAAIELAREIREIDSRAARWIASDALRELESEAVQRRLQRRG